MSDGGTPDPDMVQISKSNLAILQKTYKLASSLYDDPEVGVTVKKAIKRIDPSTRIPELDVAEPLIAPVRERQDALEAQNKTLAEQLEKLNQERVDERDLNSLQRSLDAAQAKHRLTPDGMAEVRKIMAERNVADPEVAAQYVVSNIEPAKPMTGSNFGPSDLDVFGIKGDSAEDDIKALHADPLRWMDKAVPAIMQEFEQDAA